MGKWKDDAEAELENATLMGLAGAVLTLYLTVELRLSSSCSVQIQQVRKESRKRSPLIGNGVRLSLWRSSYSASFQTEITYSKLILDSIYCSHERNIAHAIT